MAKSHYIIGIDLGTTNSVLAYVDRRTPEELVPQLPVLDIAQLVDAGRVQGRPKLPSFLYLPERAELPEGSLELPWDKQRDFAIGEFAKNRGAQVPGRLVASAKSWLCHAGVDRTSEILPWGAPEEVERLSPVEASCRYLQHLKEAWNHSMCGENEAHRLEKQEVILTVPASFDEVARELTAEAAEKAGLERVHLIEEPQAAFYSWLFEHRDSWENLVQADQLILVCDVGGGTSDFSLIQVEARNGAIGFRRIAVGDHLLLGGDNMDLALAAEIEKVMTGPGGRLDSSQWSVLRQACRGAKERLFSDAKQPSVSVAIPGRSSRLVGGTRHGEVTRSMLERIVMDGFFPTVGPDEIPKRSSKGALQEFGLPYAADPAISKHLAEFLIRDRGHSCPARAPDLVLFNGGVFKPDHLRQRTIELLGRWYGDRPPPAEMQVAPEKLDTAVARGAAYYGLVREGRGVRIAGGAPRSYYVGIELPTEQADSIGAPQPSALCIAAQGMEEGEEVEVAGREFHLLIRQPVMFPFYSSTTRPLDTVGDLVTVEAGTLRALPPIQTTLRSGRKNKAEQVLVRLHALLTEVGTLETWCVSTDGQRRWRLQFEVRNDIEDELAPGQTSGDVAEEDLVSADRIESGRQLIVRTFEQSPTDITKELRPGSLMKNLEAVLERSRKSWPPGALRGLFTAALEQADRRRASAIFEARWFNLAGFLLRPGYGYPLDEWKVKQLWRLFDKGLVFSREVAVRAEWWILWRRISGGLPKSQQTQLFHRLAQELLESPGGKKRRRPRLGQDEIEKWRTAANLERIPPRQKLRLGEELWGRLRAGTLQGFEYWALGRLGARLLFYGPADTAISREAAERWLGQLLDSGDLSHTQAAFALAQIARRTGDRALDICDELREQVLDALQAVGAREHLIQLVAEVTALGAEDRAQAFGESLPPALSLVR